MCRQSPRHQCRRWSRKLRHASGCVVGFWWICLCKTDHWSYVLLLLVYVGVVVLSSRWLVEFYLPTRREIGLGFNYSHFWWFSPLGDSSSGDLGRLSIFEASDPLLLGDAMVFDHLLQTGRSTSKVHVNLMCCSRGQQKTRNLRQGRGRL